MPERILLLADIHGNAEALRAVVEAERERGYNPEETPVYCAGDIVGYGPFPGECIRILRELSVRSVAGNHDAAVRGTVRTDWFNSMARRAIQWTKEELSTGDIDFLADLPMTVVQGNLRMVHGSPSEPLREYVRSARDARRVLDQAHGESLLLGHTHKPFLYRERQSADVGTPEKDRWLSVDPDRERVVVNPGSVGQPRDGDPRASYAVWDRSRGAIRWRRVSYGVETVQSAIREAGLPERLATRLSAGI